MVVACDICLVFRDIQENTQGYLRSLILRMKLVHRLCKTCSTECQVCRDIMEEIITDRQESASGDISKSTLDLIRTHIISLHEQAIATKNRS